MEKNPWFRALTVILVFIALLYLGGLLYQVAIRFGDIILLFFLAWLLAFVLNPTARFLVRMGIPRLYAALAIYIGLLLVATLTAIMVVPNTASQLNQLGRNLPEYVQQVPAWSEKAQGWLQERGIQGLDFSSLLTTQNLIGRAESFGTMLAQNALVIAQGVASAVFNVIIVLILSFYFMIDGDRIATVFLLMLPNRYKEEARFFLDSIDKSFGGYMRGIMIQSVIYGLGTAMVMWAAGLSYVALGGAFAGFAMVIPFFGTFLAIVPPIILAGLTLSWGKIIFVSVALLLLQQVVLNVISPKLMGDSVGIHPLLVFLAMLIGVREAGIWGAIFGVPIMAVIYSMALFVYNRANPHRKIGTEPLQEETVPVLSTGLEKN